MPVVSCSEGERISCWLVYTHLMRRVHMVDVAAHVYNSRYHAHHTWHNAGVRRQRTEIYRCDVSVVSSPLNIIFLLFVFLFWELPPFIIYLFNILLY